MKFRIFGLLGAARPRDLDYFPSLSAAADRVNRFQCNSPLLLDLLVVVPSDTVPRFLQMRADG